MAFGTVLVNSVLPVVVNGIGTTGAVKDGISSAQGTDSLLNKVIVIFADLGSIGNDSSSIVAVATTNTLALQAMGQFGVAGSIVTLGCDVAILTLRVRELHKINKELDATPNDATHKFKRDVLLAKKALAHKMVTSSGVAIAGDVFLVAGSVVPVIGLAASSVSTVVAIGRIVAEKRSCETFRNTLEPMIEAYEKANPDVRTDKEAFKKELEGKGKILKDKYEDAQEKEKNAKKAYEDGLERFHRTGYDFFKKSAVKLNTEHVHAEENLKACKEHLEKHEMASNDFEAYEEALKLMITFDPDLHELQQIQAIIKAYEEHNKDALDTMGPVFYRKQLQEKRKGLKEQIKNDKSEVERLKKTVKESNKRGDLPFREIEACVKAGGALKKKQDDLAKTKAQIKDLDQYEKALGELPLKKYTVDKNVAAAAAKKKTAAKKKAAAAKKKADAAIPEKQRLVALVKAYKAQNRGMNGSNYAIQIFKRELQDKREPANRKIREANDKLQEKERNINTRDSSTMGAVLSARKDLANAKAELANIKKQISNLGEYEKACKKLKKLEEQETGKKVVPVADCSITPEDFETPPSISRHISAGTVSVSVKPAVSKTTDTAIESPKTD